MIYKKKIWLDDCRSLITMMSMYPDRDINEWKWVFDYTEFTLEVYSIYLSTKELPICDLDHDLGEDKTGMDCAKFLVWLCISKGLNLPEVYCHSANPIGRRNIESYINCYRAFSARQC